MSKELLTLMLKINAMYGSIVKTSSDLPLVWREGKTEGRRRLKEMRSKQQNPLSMSQP